jgi:hypothetical protein
MVSDTGQFARHRVASGAIVMQREGILMQLFTRSVVLTGPFAEVMGYAADMRAHVADKIGREVSLWSAMFGAPIGAMAFSTHVEGLADLQAAGAVLLGDADYHAKLDVGRGFSGNPPEDHLLTPVHGELGDHPPVGAMAVITTAAIANGQYVEAITWGIDIAKHVERVTGLPTLFLTDDYGAFGQVTWIGVSPDAASADTAGNAIIADAGYIERVSAGANLFIAGSGHRSLVARVA